MFFPKRPNPGSPHPADRMPPPDLCLVAWSPTIYSPSLTSPTQPNPTSAPRGGRGAWSPAGAVPRSYLSLLSTIEQVLFRDLSVSCDTGRLRLLWQAHCKIFYCTAVCLDVVLSTMKKLRVVSCQHLMVLVSTSALQFSPYQTNKQCLRDGLWCMWMEDSRKAGGQCWESVINFQRTFTIKIRRESNNNFLSYFCWFPLPLFFDSQISSCFSFLFFSIWLESAG